MDAIYRTSTANMKGKSLPLDYERELIASSQAGDQSAQWELLMQYRGILQATVYRVRKVTTLNSSQIEDIQSELIITFLEVLRDFNLEKHERLVHVVPAYLKSKASEMATALAVPKGVLSRFWKIYRLAKQDLRLAAEMAPEHGMSTESFKAISLALNFADYESAMDLPGSMHNHRPAPDTETQELVYKAMEAITPAERKVIEQFYGFHGLPSPLEEVAQILESSLATVKSQRTRALTKMRTALTGLDEDEVTARLGLVV